MPAYMYDYPPFTADAEEEEEEEEDSENLSDAAAIAIEIFGIDAEEEEEEDSKNLSDAGAIAIKIVGIVLTTLLVGFVCVNLVKWMFMCDAPSESDNNSENSSHNIGGNRTAAAAVGESAVAAERLEVSPSIAEMPPVPVASAVLVHVGTGTSENNGDVQDPPLAKAVSMDYCDNAVSGVSSPPPPPSAPPAE